MKSRLWIVGKGEWAEKIRTSVKRASFSNLEGIQIVKARDFETSINTMKRGDTVWFATHPQVQIIQLDNLYKTSNLELNVILEKPYAIGVADYQLLQKIDLAHSHLHLSTPWIFTSLWHYLKNQIAETKILSIKGQRLGNVVRAYCNPVEDRLPHDLYLLADLFGNEILDQLILKRCHSAPPMRAFLGAIESQIEIEVGFANQESIFWDIRTLDGVIKLDFAGHTCTYKKQTISFAHERLNALPAMLKEILHRSPMVGRNQSFTQGIKQIFSQ